MTTRTIPAEPGRAACSIRAGLATTHGHRRSANEDAALAGPTWFAVADGMGGHRAGEVASAVAIAALADTTDSAAEVVGRGARTVADIRERVADANTAIRSRGRADELSGMGATVVGAVVVHDGGRPAIAVFHVGDSRCYRVGSGRFDQLTTDHTYVQELVELGRIDAAQAATHPKRNVVTRVLGLDSNVDCDITTIEIQPCRLLLCTDGVSNELGPTAIERVLSAVDDPQDAADRLIELVLADDARDNATALVVDFDVPAFPLAG